MPCDIALRLRKTYKKAAVTWGQAATLDDYARKEQEHDQALLKFVSHKQCCPACRSEEPPFHFESFESSSIQ